MKPRAVAVIAEPSAASSVVIVFAAGTGSGPDWYISPTPWWAAIVLPGHPHLNERARKPVPRGNHPQGRLRRAAPARNAGAA